MDASGNEVVLYSFTGGAVGWRPDGLVEDAAGNLYGTTYFGGTNGPYAGTVFQITPAGKLTTLYSFCAQANCADGASPSAALLEAANGTFYGTTSGSGGEEGMGSVFRLSIGQGSER
jgi:uncharacterized repeat protein (TIGR03803 family)